MTDAQNSPSGADSAQEAAPGRTSVSAAVPRIICDTRARTATAPTSAGAQWKLEEPGRQLDANLIHLLPGQQVDTHAEPDLDVLLLVVTGDGTLGGTDEPQRLAEGKLLWLPHGSSRNFTAGEGGLSYLTVHRRRPGMQIRHRDGTDERPRR